MSDMAETKEASLHIRVTPHERARLRAAAERGGLAVSEFVRNAACAKADEALGDNAMFVLDAARWAAFVAALDAEGHANPALERLLSSPSRLETAA